jgi:hypothetical protein
MEGCVITRSVYLQKDGVETDAGVGAEAQNCEVHEAKMLDRQYLQHVVVGMGRLLHFRGVDALGTMMLLNISL